MSSAAPAHAATSAVDVSFVDRSAALDRLIAEGYLVADRDAAVPLAELEAGLIAGLVALGVEPRPRRVLKDVIGMVQTLLQDAFLRAQVRGADVRVKERDSLNYPGSYGFAHVNKEIVHGVAFRWDGAKAKYAEVATLALNEHLDRGRNDEGVYQVDVASIIDAAMISRGLTSTAVMRRRAAAGSAEDREVLNVVKKILKRKWAMSFKGDKGNNSKERVASGFRWKVTSQ